MAGGPKSGFPAGPKGLKHRFLQGVLLPACAGGGVTPFGSAVAEAAWRLFGDLLAQTNPASTSDNVMQEPLVPEEVWVAFDHVARIADAFNQKPGDFVAFPAPAGPEGRARMLVIAGVATPRTAPDVQAAKAFVADMMQPETQVATLRATTFLPVMDVALPDAMPAPVKASGPAIAAMPGAADALAVLLPMGMALPLAVVFIRTGHDDSLFGLALGHTTLALPFAVLIPFALFSGIPVAREEAAWTLGCSRFTAFAKVILPLAAPGIAASAVLAFVIIWNKVCAAAVPAIENRTLTAFLVQPLDHAPLHLKFAGAAAPVLATLILIFAVR